MMPVIIGVTSTGMFLVTVLVGAIGAVTPEAEDGGGGIACLTRSPRKIPPDYQLLYRQAAARYDVPWQLLAAVGKIETDHGRGSGPGVKSGANYAGAAGPMQFMPGTWRAFGVDGNKDGKKNIYDPADAIPAAAAYLKHSGAPKRTKRALWHYNHDDAYVKKVLGIAKTYTTASGGKDCALTVLSGAGRGTKAAHAAMHWIGTPYSWGGGGLKGPTRGIGRGRSTVGFDCSGLTRYAWHRAGVALPRIAADQWRRFPHIRHGRQQPGDLVFFRGSMGSSRNPGHVGLIIGKDRMVEAPRTGLKVRVSRISNRRDLVGYARPVPRRAAR